MSQETLRELFKFAKQIETQFVPSRGRMLRSNLENNNLKNQISKLIFILNRLENCSENNMDRSINAMFEYVRKNKIIEDVQQGVNFLASVRNTRETSDDISNLSLITKDLYYLKRDFNCVRLSFQPLSITIRTDPIFLTHASVNLGNPVEIGEIDIQLFLTGIEEFRIRAKPVRDSTKFSSERSGSDRYFHPHINIDGSICLGNNGETINSAIRQCRFLDTFELLSFLLKNYNSGSPYRVLNSWVMPECQSCGDSTRLKCFFTHQYVCESCAMIVLSENGWPQFATPTYWQQQPACKCCGHKLQFGSLCPRCVELNIYLIKIAEIEQAQEREKAKIASFKILFEKSEADFEPISERISSLHFDQIEAINRSNLTYFNSTYSYEEAKEIAKNSFRFSFPVMIEPELVGQT